MSSHSSSEKSPEHEFGEALILLSQASESERKRKSPELLSSSSETEEMVGSGDEGSFKEDPESKRIKLPNLSSLPRMNINRIVNSSSENEIIHVQTVPVPSSEDDQLTNSNSLSWMDRYNNVRRSINTAIYPSSEEVRWINEQIEEMKQKNLTPERSELLKQAMNIIAFNFKSQPTSVHNRVLSAFPPAALPSSHEKINSPPSSPEQRSIMQGNRKMKRNQLSSWMCTQRQDKKSGELPEYRIKLLDLIGFVWSKQHKQKQQQAKANGTYEVDNGSKEAESDVLSSNHVSSLNGRSKRNHDLWMVRYHELILFKKRHGHLKVPTLIPDDE